MPEDMSALLRFVQERIEEDERIALAASRDQWRVDPWRNDSNVELLVIADFDQGPPAIVLKNEAAPMAEQPSAYDLWKQAGGQTDDFSKAEYRRLLIEHGLIVPLGPGEKAEPLPCGWPAVRYPDNLQWLETAHLTAEERVEALGPKPWRVPSFEEDEDA